MTKSEFIRKRSAPLIKMIENFVHEEDRPGVKAKILLWVNELILDVQNLGANDPDDIDVNNRFGDTPLDEDNG